MYSTAAGKNRFSLTSAASLSLFFLAFPLLPSSCQMPSSRIPGFSTALLSYHLVSFFNAQVIPSFRKALLFLTLLGMSEFCSFFKYCSLFHAYPDLAHWTLSFFWISVVFCICFLVLILITLYIVVTFVHVLFIFSHLKSGIKSSDKSVNPVLSTLSKAISQLFLN